MICSVCIKCFRYTSNLKLWIKVQLLLGLFRSPVESFKLQGGFSGDVFFSLFSVSTWCLLLLVLLYLQDGPEGIVSGWRPPFLCSSGPFQNFETIISPRVVKTSVVCNMPTPKLEIRCDITKFQGIWTLIQYNIILFMYFGGGVSFF